MYRFLNLMKIKCLNRCEFEGSFYENFCKTGDRNLTFKVFLQKLVARAFGLKLEKILRQKCKTRLCEPEFIKFGPIRSILGKIKFKF